MVIQRLQTLFLFFAAVAMAVYAFCPVMGFVADSGLSSLYAIGGAEGDARSYLLLILEALIVVMNLVTIFKYRAMKFQQRLCSVIVLLDVALLVTIGAMALMQKGNAIVTLTIWLILPFVSMAFTMWAGSRIKADRKLLSDSERLR